VAQPQFSALLVGAFAVVALLLAALGLYASVAHTVRLRTREAGLRVALGATPSRVMLELGSRAAFSVAAGLVVGLVGVSWLGRFLRSQLYGVDPLDPATLVSATLILGMVAVLACAQPLWRSVRLDPVKTLRAD
jgi:putative ABC transport system permease protein